MWQDPPSMVRSGVPTRSSRICLWHDSFLFSFIYFPFTYHSTLIATKPLTMSEEIEKIYDDLVAAGLLPGVTVFAGDRSGRLTPSQCSLHYGNISR